MISATRLVEVERLIGTQIIDDALKLGYAVSINNGGDDHEIARATDREAILENMFAADEDRIIFHEILDGKPRMISCGWVLLIYGNDGYDVISDYVVNNVTEKVLRGAEDLTKKLEQEDTKA